MTDRLLNVGALREALGWTQQQLAAFCDVDRSTVSKWEQEPPAKGPAMILLHQLNERISFAASNLPAPADCAAGSVSLAEPAVAEGC